jgi:hypothetical protein
MACLSISIWLWLTMAGTAAGQAVVEAGLGAAGSATAAASSRSVGNAISGLAGSLDKAIKAGQQDSDAPSAASSTVVPKAAPAAKTPPSSSSSPSSHTANAAAPPPPKWEDPSGIQAGLSYAELVRRFGPPALEISGETGRSLTYAGKDGTFRLDVVGDQVTSIRKPKS